MTVTELVEQSARVALAHATELQARLQEAVLVDEAEGASIAQCGVELRRLVGDIASLRNATLLLQGQTSFVA